MPFFYFTCMMQLAFEDFSEHIGTTFSFSRTIETRSVLASSGSSALPTLKEELRSDMILTKAKQYELDARDKRKEDTTGKLRQVPFTLHFEGIHEPYLPQGNYTVRHPAFSEPLEIFITCLGPTDDTKGYVYEAVFG